jgi:hypothetical protein
MTYDTWKCSGADYAGDDRDDRDESAVRCARCSSQGLLVCWCPDEFDAAHSGEGDDMLVPKDEQKYLCSDEAGRAQEREAYLETVVENLVIEASVKLLRRAVYAIEREVERRKAENDSKRKELEEFEKPNRAKRKDAGTKRGPKAVVAA